MDNSKQTQDRFGHIIGQKKLKRQINFLLDAHDKTKRLAPLGLLASKGMGKTLVAKAIKEYISENCKTENGKKARGLIVDSGSLPKNPADFVELFWMSKIQNKDVFCIFDEAHQIPKQLASGLFLSLLQRQPDPIIRVNLPEIGEITVDQRRQKFALCTTERNSLFHALRDRLKILDFEEYTEDELGQIVNLSCDNVVWKGDILNDISKVLRGSPRKANDVAEDIMAYVANKQDPMFGINEWNDLRSIMNINPLGLTEDEMNYMRHLRKKKKTTLTVMSAAIGHQRSSVQQIETFLMKAGLMKVVENSMRQITKEGESL
tara:strand:- start:1996 stop:2952 length:957 start_codon:yes stop_codon:yes gene_type:complete